jgi:hypothetical protein
MKNDAAVPAWARTTSLDIAAAMSVLGIQVHADVSEDRISGKGWKTLLLGMESVPAEAIGMKPIEGEAEQLPSHQTKAILGLLKNGDLHKADPHHPAVDVIRACTAREQLMRWARTGRRYRLGKVKGASRYMLIEGEELESVKALPPGLMTRDLKLASCLVVLGCPIIRLGGQMPDTEFYFAGQGYGMPPPVTADLSQAFRTKRLEEISPEHPLLWMMQGLSNRDAIANHVRDKKKLVLIRGPGNGRASLVSENAKGRTMDRVKRHLGVI